MRQHGGWVVERHGALRPFVAAGFLLDPCCGSGTILAEALAAGWSALGSDIDADAVRIARRNIPTAALRVADVRRLDRADGTVSAWVASTGR